MKRPTDHRLSVGSSPPLEDGMPITMRCQVRYSDGTPCPGPVWRDGLCQWHHPGRVAEFRHDPARNWYAYLTEPSTAKEIIHMAQAIAKRRRLHLWAERAILRRGPGIRTAHRRGWSRHIADEERHPLVRDTLQRLVSLQDTLGRNAGLDAWLAEPDAQGWPSLDRTSTTRQALEQRIAADRHQMALLRGGSDAVATSWRRAHPAWRPGLTGAEADAFDDALLVECAELHQRWIFEMTVES